MKGEQGDGIRGDRGGEGGPVGTGRDPLQGGRKRADAGVRARHTGEGRVVEGRGRGPLRAVPVRCSGSSARRARRADKFRDGPEPAGRGQPRRGLCGGAGPARRYPRRQRHGRGDLPDRDSRSPRGDRPPRPYQLRRVRGVLPVAAQPLLSSRSALVRPAIRGPFGADAQGASRPAPVAEGGREEADGRRHARRLLREPDR